MSAFSSLSTGRRALCVVYVAVALVALVGTWSQNLAFFALPDSSGLAFVRACFVNPAAASITIDILLLCVAAFVFMVVEARRLGVRYMWVYVVLSGMIAISVMFPLFLVARELRLAAREAEAAGPSTLTTA